MNTYRRMMMIGLSFVICHLSFCPAGAQSLYEQHMKLGRMFETCGNIILAEHHYLTAAKEVKGIDSELDAQLSLVRVLCFCRPVEAQQLNDRLQQACRADNRMLQQHLALDGFISFKVGNKTAFQKANEAYIALCQQDNTLPTTYDQALQAMNEALNGFYNDALHTLLRADVDILTRHNISVAIREMQGDSSGVIRELQAMMNSCDSLEALMYAQNQEEVNITANMTQAQQKAEKNSSKRLNIILMLLVVIAVMIIAWLLFRRRQLRDIEMKNDQLKTALKMAGETDVMKKEFVRRVSHEIRTPLNAITGFNDILNNSEIQLGAEERKDLMNRIAENVKAITNIVDELLQTADDESTMDYSKNDVVLCNQFFSNILYAHSKDVNANIVLDYTTKVINRFTIETNAEAVKKVVDHLIDNAIKFTQRGKIELNCREEKKMVYLTLTDTGRGVPADKQDEIFEQFVKADAFQQGIGLGLTVSKKIAQKLGGDLVLDKNYQTGARFVLSLPVK